MALKGHIPWNKGKSEIEEGIFKKYILMDDGCWKWVGGVPHAGYGQVQRMGKYLGAHRLFYERFKEKIPKGMFIDHLCRNTICVNPSHMEVVTPAENTRRGRTAKLSKDDVYTVRNLYKKGELTQAILGRIFGVGQDEISRIVNKKRFANI